MFKKTDPMATIRDFISLEKIKTLIISMQNAKPSIAR